MQAMMEKSPANPMNGMHPSVTYDREALQITATVIATYVEHPTDIKIDAPLIGIPGDEEGRWTVLWKLQPDATLQWVEFHCVGVEIGHTPPNVSVVASGKGDSADEWKVTFENYVNGANSFSYLMRVQGLPSLMRLDKPILKTFHDPTIVVTPDPMGGVG